jgi:hypothetical protein
MPNLTVATAAQITEAHRLHLVNMNLFTTCNLIKRTIIQQINTAIDNDCLADLIDDDTVLLQGTIPEIFDELYSSFGAITPQSLATARATLEATTYNHSRPILNVFTAINEYANMADAAGAAETATQLINIGLIIITRSTIFASDIRKWHDKPGGDKDWPNFKEHFKTAQRAIKQSQPTATIDLLGYHEQAAAATEAADQIAEQQMQQQLDNMANAAQQNQTMIDQIKSLTATISNLQTNQQKSGGGGGRGGSGRGRGGNSSVRTQGKSNERAPPAYCWTHGNCAHKSAECKTKATGHINKATYADMQGGSTNRCHWLA